jgi:uncharacterized protein (TIGR00661 family)
MAETTKKTVLFCPLDWGLGHIARDLPLIREYAEHGHRVVVAASESICQWLQSEAPSIETTIFNGPVISYSKNGFSFTRMTLQLPGLLSWPKKEKTSVAKLVDIYHPHLIVSDNRYGARHPKVHSVIITHQLCIKLPRTLKWAEYPLHLLIKSLIRKFDECWIPDFPKSDSLAGELVHKYPFPENALLIGPLSRFDGPQFRGSFSSTENSVLGIISGPEPQRTIFENLLTNTFQHHKGKKSLITGKLGPTAKEMGITKNSFILPHQDTPSMAEMIRNHNLIVSRSGYSTIMDMYYLNRNVVIVPTPGQTEQEYLADYHSKKGHIKVAQDKAADLDLGILLNRVMQANHQKSSMNFRTIILPSLTNPDQPTKRTNNK